MAVLSWLVGGVLAVAVGSVGVGTAYAQECDPVEVAKLLADDGAIDDHFGRSVSIDGDTAIIGADLDDDNGTNSGSAYVFTRIGGVWTQQFKLIPDDGAAGDWFGQSVSLDDDTAVIGAYRDDDNGFASGSAYIFTRSGGVWSQQAKLLPTDGAPNEWFGSSVSICGDSVVIGAANDDDNGTDSGSSYVFTRTGGVWTQQAKLQPDDGAENDWFGVSVFISDNTVIVGAWWDDDNGSDSGSAYVFTRSGGDWTQQAKLLPGDGAAADYFGWRVSIHDETAIVGAYLDDDRGTNSGSAYVFSRAGGVWTQQAKLAPDDGSENDWFGVSVFISGSTAIIGAFLDDDMGDDSGSAYVYIRVGGAWTQWSKLVAADGAADDNFGSAVASNGDFAIVVARYDDDSGSASGSAYIFGHIRPCPADLTGDCQADTIDFLTFLGAWSLGDPLADWNDDGTVNTLDFLAYLADWSAGC